MVSSYLGYCVVVSSSDPKVCIVVFKSCSKSSKMEVVGEGRGFLEAGDDTGFLYTIGFFVLGIGFGVVEGRLVVEFFGFLARAYLRLLEKDDADGVG